MLALFTFGLKSLGLAEPYTLSFVAPLIITMLSVPMLKQTVPPRHWISIAVGLGGVASALRPDQAAFLSVGALAALPAATCYALSKVIGRIVSRSEPSATLVFCTTASKALGGGVLSLPHWVSIVDAHWPMLVGLAIGGFHGQLAIVEAFRHGQASADAPFEYIALAWPWRWTGPSGGCCRSAARWPAASTLIRREALQARLATPPLDASRTKSPFTEAEGLQQPRDSGRGM